MLALLSLENVLRQEGDSEGEYDHMVCFLCNENYLVPPCKGVVSGERFYTRHEDSRTFGRHRRVESEHKEDFIYLQYNHTSDSKSL